MTTRGIYIGRFQPFHKGHLYAVKEVLNEVDELIIGIGSAQESHTLENPFTAGERMLMIRSALVEDGVDLCRVYIVPIPDIAMNHVWVRYVSMLVPQFNIAYSNNPLVMRLFKEAGYNVKPIPLYDRRKFSGKKIRELMLKGGSWEELVPKSVAKIINEIDGVSRIREIARSDEEVEGK